jgi:ankyrin repeat protein
MDILNELLAAKTNILLKTTRGYLALHVAAQHGHVDVLNLLLLQRDSTGSIHTTDCFKFTPLHWSAFNGHQEAVRYLLNADADINRKDAFGWTPLHEAAYNGHAHVVETLLSSTPQPSLRFRSGNWVTPLHLAARHGHFKIVQILLNKDGSLATAVDRDGDTPLHEVVRGWQASQAKQYIAIARLLLEKKGNPSAENRRGCTPIFKAHVCGIVPLKRLFVQAVLEGQHRGGKTVAGKSSLFIIAANPWNHQDADALGVESATAKRS